MLTSCPEMLVRTRQGKCSLWLPWPRCPGELEGTVGAAVEPHPQASCSR